ncbi:DNA polymerase V [Catalinimonas alkaloidigena]|uniref:DNA polymerase V n=1 Tax=Catalinimonas alkaloidigena TaxID=1075417 RepID=A0A1G8YJM2_9BACT|nr:translesion error-prone DNA polymerase V autoproteolytic subunit [Catalinimonas alkaloidigena]SDK02290.1 DNA polymerase V [Catalinimonas alkaloidigena]
MLKAHYSHGGRRPGAGRPTGTGKYKEATKPVRVPLSLIPSVQRLISEAKQTLPLYACGVAAGSPTPADDHLEKYLDLNEYLARRPDDTFLVRAHGDSMVGAGIHDGDILVVDRSAEPEDGRIIIAVLNGELTVKRLRQWQETEGNRVELWPENALYHPISVGEGTHFFIWGVVTNVIHSL